MLNRVSEFRLVDVEHVSFARFYLTDNTRKLISTLTTFSQSELILLIKAELLWNKRKDLLKRMTARYAKIERQREWKLMEQIIDGRYSLDELESAVKHIGEENRNLSESAG